MILHMQGKRYLMSCVALFLITVMWVALLGAQPRPVKPGPNYVWVPFKRLNNGSRIPGHWRLERRIGYIWIAGHENSNDEWVPGHWWVAYIDANRDPQIFRATMIAAHRDRILAGNVNSDQSLGRFNRTDPGIGGTNFDWGRRAVVVLASLADSPTLRLPQIRAHK